MAKQASIEQDGTIIEALSNAMFRGNHRPHLWQDEDALH